MKRQDREFEALLFGLISLHPFAKGDITVDGVNWSPEITTSDADFTEVESIIIDMGTPAEIEEVYFALTHRIKSSSTTKFVKFKWQARNKDGTWVDLHVEVTYLSNADTYVEYSYSGTFKLENDFHLVPFEVRLVIQREDATENAIAQVKNSSCLSVIINPREAVER